MHKKYVVYGDMSSECANEQYPLMTLCHDCASNVQIAGKEGDTHEDCHACGAKTEG